MGRALCGRRLRRGGAEWLIMCCDVKGMGSYRQTDGAPLDGNRSHLFAASDVHLRKCW